MNHFRLSRLPRGCALIAILALSGCAGLLPPTAVESNVTTEWHVPLPHEGTVGALARWWAQQGDPLLVELIEAAQAVSPSVAQALSRVEVARANQALASAALLPGVNAQFSATRGVLQPDMAVQTTQSLGLQAAWELDIVGANRAVSDAARANAESSRAQWHEARVSVAAEVANAYYGLSVCRQLLDVARSDAASRNETARLSGLSASAGLVAPAVAALARASAAEGSSAVTRQATQCAGYTKALVALTAIPEDVLQEKLTKALAKPAQAAAISVTSVPAQTVAQRPDVYAAQRDVIVASAQVGSAIAQRLPRLTLSGSIAATRLSSNGADTSGPTWSFGPLALTLPVFDAGQRAANVTAARAGYEASVIAYQSRVRQAVREVEEALLSLQSTQARRADTDVAASGYAESFAATQTRYQQGLASLPEQEDARRALMGAQNAQLQLQLERNLAWVNLYRALGGGWEASPN